jgi:hypothetical protein
MRMNKNEGYKLRRMELKGKKKQDNRQEQQEQEKERGQDKIF